MKVKVVKNKIAPPFREVEIDILFNEGISRNGEILDMGVEKEVIKKSGAFYSYGDIKLGQGKENARESLASQPALTKEIEDAIRAKI